jgi:anti-sigma28 factor (negative regulator of flagellin synthesis)
MSVLSWQKNESAVVAKNAEIPLGEGAGNKAQGRITALAMQNNPSLPRIRKKKVVAVRQQLAEGRYNLDERLDAALERLLAAVTN